MIEVFKTAMAVMKAQFDKEQCEDRVRATTPENEKLLENVGKDGWTEVAYEIAEEMLGCVPPAYMGPNKFACGEAYSHVRGGVPVYHCFRNFNHRSHKCEGRICSIDELKAA